MPRLPKMSKKPLTAAARALCAAAPLFLAAAPATAEPIRYTIDETHFSIGFSANHIGFADTLGLFLTASGSFMFDEATQTLTDVRIVVDANSVFTNHDARDNHLRGGDFLDADAHPEIVFVMTEARPTSDTTGVIVGDLTLRGVTRPIEVEVTLNQIADYPFGHRKRTLGVSARATVTRSEWGMTYAQGGIVGDDIPLVIELEAIPE